MNEIWKDIKGYEGLYQVSNLGRVKNCYGKIKKTHINESGYEIVCLYNVILKQSRPHRVHRLVAKTFIQNCDNRQFVNHIDGNKLNNCVSNLEWCTAHENMEHSYNKGLHKTKSINQYTKQGKFVKKWYNAITVERNCGICHSNIVKCCLGKRKTAGGYIWKYESEVMPIYE